MKGNRRAKILLTVSIVAFTSGVWIIFRRVLKVRPLIDNQVVVINNREDFQPFIFTFVIQESQQRITSRFGIPFSAVLLTGSPAKNSSGIDSRKDEAILGTNLYCWTFLACSLRRACDAVYRYELSLDNMILSEMCLALFSLSSLLHWTKNSRIHWNPSALTMAVIVPVCEQMFILLDRWWPGA